MDATWSDKSVYHALFEHTADAILALKGEVIVECNAQAVELFGCPKDQIIGQTPYRFSPERQPDERDSREKGREKIRAALEDGPQRFEWLHIRCDGAYINAEVALTRVDVAGEAMLVAVVRDITFRKRLEDAVHNVAAGISSATGDLFFNLLVQYISRALGASCAYVGELVGDSRIRTLAVSTDGQSGKNFEYDMAGSPCKVVVGDGLCLFANDVGQQFPDDSMLQDLRAQGYIGVPLFDSSHHPVGLLAAVKRTPLEDTAFAEYIMRIFAGRTSAELERKKALQAVMDEKRLTETIINSLPGVFYMIDQHGSQVWRNKNLQEVAGLEPDEHGKTEALVHVVEEERELARLAVAQAFAEGSSEGKVRVKHRDGTVHIYYCTGSRVEIDGSLYLVGAGVDITELKNAELALQVSAEKYRTIFENAPVGIFQSTVDGLFLSANPALARMLGYDSPEQMIEEVTSIADKLYVNPGARPDFVRAAMESEGFHQFENEYRRRDGSTIVANLYFRAQREKGQVTFLEGFMEDITDRKRSDEDKRQFYRETVLSVTEGKLVICDGPELQPYIEKAHMSIEVGDAFDLAPARRQAREFFAKKGLSDERLDAFVAGFGEAATNAVKHANGGHVYMGTTDDAVWVGVSDHGTGIEHLTLPRAVLLRGFSTAHTLGIGYSVMLAVADRILLATSKEGTTVILMQELKEKPPRMLFDQLPDVWEMSKPR